MRAPPSLLLLAVLVLALPGCVAPGAQPEDSFREVSRVEIPLPRVPDAGQPFRRAFEQFDTRGTVNDSGGWTIEHVVNHTRLRCGLYEVGIQLGRATAGCAQAAWIGEPQYGTRERHCNSAPRIHAGGGTLPVPREQIAAATCVRVLVRCSGACR